MPPIIDAVLFDLGGTLKRTRRHTEAERRNGLASIDALLGTHLSPEEWDRRLLPRAREYKRWAEDTHEELTEEEIWTRWMLPEYPAEQVRPRALDLHRAWRGAFGTSAMQPQAGRVIRELFRRGYRLGVVSNTNSRTDAPEALERDGILDCFEIVTLSAVHGRRKPDRRLFDLATHAMELEPGRCAFVGNRRDTDLAGAKQAGFAKVVLLRRPEVDPGNPQPEALEPDAWIDDLEELLAIFPQRYEAKRSQPGRAAAGVESRWKASLSTMWGSPQFPHLDGFLRSATEMGFSGVELNHEVNSAMLAAANLGLCPISSVHEPCPADVPTGRMAVLDWQVSSEDEHSRKQAVRMAKRSIYLARQVGAGLVVVHPGNIGGDRTLEKDLRALFNAGEVDSERYCQLRDHLIDRRSQLAAPRIEAALRSLYELLACARDEGIILGLENRYHYLDIPTPDEMERLLACGGPNELGLVYDVGHAQTMERLGFFTHEEWLRRFAGRIVEVHLHDVRGIDDHLAPGLGEVDFDGIAASLPRAALRTCELRPQNTPEQVVEGMGFLTRHRCVEAL
jgi:HAD superfamily hydrolase (TIGR01549 family)